jgi:stage V sporulation protein R
VHHFEGKPLVKEFIHNTMLGLEYLWGGKIMLETTEVKSIKKSEQPQQPVLPGMPAARPEPAAEPEIEWQRVRYTMKEKKLSKGLI